MKKTGKARITILADNAARPPYRAEHGFSALLEAGGAAGVDEGGARPLVVLLDTGRGAVFGNAAAAGIDLSRVTDVILSHGHYDHTDALPETLDRCPAARVHASSRVGREHYSVSTGPCRAIGLSVPARSALAALGAGRYNAFAGAASVADGYLGLVEGIPRVHSLEGPSPLLFADALCSVPDLVEDELALWFETEQGLVILTGCCHAGFINTCEHVLARSAETRVRAVIGGFHLAGVREARLEATAAYIAERGIERVVACHCTGDAETAWLTARLGATVTKGEAGMVVEF